jgi:hypothetical protein
MSHVSELREEAARLLAEADALDGVSRGPAPTGEYFRAIQETPDERTTREAKEYNERRKSRVDEEWASFAGVPGHDGSCHCCRCTKLKHIGMRANYSIFDMVLW